LGGTGGLASASNGQVKFNGGTAANTSAFSTVFGFGAGGGGGDRFAGNGCAAQQVPGGTGGPNFGGNGADGSGNQTLGNTGGIRGGGGGGAGANNSVATLGGTGGRGELRITFYL